MSDSLSSSPLRIDIKKGSSSPNLSVKIIKTSDGLPFNLTGSSAVFSMKRVGATTNKIDDVAANISDPTNGIVEYPWGASDTDTEGKYRGEFVITLPSSKILKIPQDGYITINILETI